MTTEEIQSMGEDQIIEWFSKRWERLNKADLAKRLQIHRSQLTFVIRRKKISKNAVASFPAHCIDLAKAEIQSYQE